MGQALIVDGKVVYGDVSELKLIQLIYVNQEIDRLQADMVRLQDALDAAKATLDAIDTAVSAKASAKIRVQAPPPGVPAQTPLKDKLK